MIDKNILEDIYQTKENEENQETEYHKDINESNKINKNEIQYRNFKKIIYTFYNEEINSIDSEKQVNIDSKDKIKIEPQIFYDKFSSDMKLEFKIGIKKFYKIKNLAEFYTRVLNKEFYRYGDKLQFIHTIEIFEEESRPLLEFILKYAEFIKYANSNSNSNYRYYGKALNESSIIISNSGIDDLFEILKTKQVPIQRNYKTETIEFTEEQPNIEFSLRKIGEEEYSISPNIEIFNISILQGKDHKYVLDNEKIYQCSKEFEECNLKLLEIFRKNYITELKFGKGNLQQFFSIIIPKVKDAIKIENLSKEEIKKYQPEELVIKVFLDFDKKDYLVADVKFCYGKNELNPLDEKVKIDFPRNIIKETKALNIFKRTGFMFDTNNLRFILPNNDDIYQFLTEEIDSYMQQFEILVTDNFKTKQIKHPKIGGLGVKIDNNLLEIDLKNLEIDKEELKNIMERYSLKKKYHRLKDGSFINIENNKEIEFIDKLVTGMNIDYKEITDGEIKIPVYRSLYLNQLLKEIKGINITKNDEYRKIVHQLDKENLEETAVPEALSNILRYYQKTGFQWLKTLDYYKFGGILADDMGLGKTIQILSIIVDYIFHNDKEVILGQEEIKTKNNKRTSLVISPSSLTLNWQNEAEKFAKDLKTTVIMGNLTERKRKINDLEKYDLVITSYDLLKRDIELYKEKNYQFRFIIADEAQYLKNSSTQNAKSIKQIKADTRYALTGTPIENSLSELWSIFDFIMPDYLFSYKKFKTLYEMPIIKDEEQNAMKKLKMLIQPFILRRTKNEVLTELPEKTVTVLENEMGEEQKNIYLSYLAQTKQELAEQIDLNGYERSHMQILAALTRLRQICCHPSLFIERYEDGSSKLEQCMEIIQEAVNSGHKILLFSSYTSMFKIMEKELKENNILYYKLTGATKVDERIKMVEEFNKNSKVQLFLISLKAGGTGLNLTGADTVIHYDPWWNISTENQATDRAHRIGQKNNVQVYKLITKNSIEEKIYELQQKKSLLIDNVLDTKASFISKLSKEEIMNLFN